MLRLPLQPVFWGNEYPNTNGESDHQGSVFIQTYKQPHGLAVTQEGNIFQRMKVCLERRITLYSRLSPFSPHPEQTGLKGCFSLSPLPGRGGISGICSPFWGLSSSVDLVFNISEADSSVYSLTLHPLESLCWEEYLGQQTSCASH